MKQIDHVNSSDVIVEMHASDTRFVGSGLSDENQDGSWVFHQSRAVILATGGIGSLFERSTNPPESSGDGLAMAARAGARLADLEFVQFHPTALACDSKPMPLLTEALRGEGAVLLDT
jgi:L-aspartate oxidase